MKAEVTERSLREMVGLTKRILWDSPNIRSRVQELSVSSGPSGGELFWPPKATYGHLQPLEAATAPGAAPRTVPCRAQIPLECDAPAHAHDRVDQREARSPGAARHLSTSGARTLSESLRSALVRAAAPLAAGWRGRFDFEPYTPQLKVASLPLHGTTTMWRLC